MQRLAASGMIALAEEPRAAPVGGFRRRQNPIRRSAPATCAPRPSGRCAWRACSRAGGFPEEALPLLGKAIGTAAAAKLAALGELEPGASIATPLQVHDLVGRGALPRQAETTLAALRSAAERRNVDAEPLFDMAALAMADLDQGARETAPRAA